MSFLKWFAALAWGRANGNSGGRGSSVEKQADFPIIDAIGGRVISADTDACMSIFDGDRYAAPDQCPAAKAAAELYRHRRGSVPGVYEPGQGR